MTRHRFFISKEQIKDTSVYLSDDQARQIHHVLRLRQGDRINILTNDGWEYEVELLTTNSDQATGTLTNGWLVGNEPTIKLALYQSMLKQDKFEWVLQKGTEIGVTSFIPIITKRTIIRQIKLKQNKIARWQRIISEAAEQSGRGRIPTLSQPIEYAAALTTVQTEQSAMIPWESESKNTIAAYLDRNKARNSQLIQNVALFIGPEGGFSDQEVLDARGAGIMPVTLGPRILRAETAALIAATITLHELGEMGAYDHQDDSS